MCLHSAILFLKYVSHRSWYSKMSLVSILKVAEIKYHIHPFLPKLRYLHKIVYSTIVLSMINQYELG